MAAPGKKLDSNKPAAPAGAHARRFPRFALDVRMQVRMFQDGEFRNCWGRSTELGQDGIGATLTGELETGEIVSLEIPLPLSPYPLKCAPSSVTARACATASNSSPSATTSAK